MLLVLGNEALGTIRDRIADVRLLDSFDWKNGAHCIKGWSLTISKSSIDRLGHGVEGGLNDRNGCIVFYLALQSANEGCRLAYSDASIGSGNPMLSMHAA